MLGEETMLDKDAFHAADKDCGIENIFGEHAPTHFFQAGISIIRDWRDVDDIAEVLILLRKVIC